VDVALGPNGKAMRISLFKSSVPEDEADKFIKEHQLSKATYYEELVAMLRHAKNKAMSNQQI